MVTATVRHPPSHHGAHVVEGRVGLRGDLLVEGRRERPQEVGIVRDTRDVEDPRVKDEGVAWRESEAGQTKRRVSMTSSALLRVSSARVGAIL